MDPTSNPPGDPQTHSSNNNNNNNPVIATFMEITSSSPDEALFFLESHNFDLDSAIATFFESTATAALPSAASDDAAGEFVSPQPSPASLSPASSPSRSRSHSPPPSSQYNLRSRPNATTGAEGRRSSTRQRGVSGVRTLADLDDDDDDDSDSDRPPQYFAGGHKSGMLVQDPSKDNSVDAIFDQARRVGATEGPADVYQPSSSSRSFAGTGRLLSGERVSSSPLDVPPEVVTHTITFWRNGFTVDDGPLRMLNDEANAPFLESITRSECPAELQPANRRTKVQCNLMRKDENYPEQEKRQLPFKGVGRTLGASSSSNSEPSVAAAATILTTAPSPVVGLVVDEKLPSTSIQLRLADGTRMVSRFNYQHTIRDIHAFIDASRPARQGTYMLQMMGFPPKKLTDLDQTIEEAGLANSVVMQKFD